MDNFSMKLDLSNFFKDERRQSLVFIAANWENIKDVQDHIQNLFKLKDINLLTSDGCFLPPRESIQVLKAAKGLKAFRFSDPNHNDFASPAPVARTASKKRKYTSAEEEVELQPSSPSSRPSKRSKKKESSIVAEIPAETPDLSIRPFELQLRSSQNSTKYDKSNEEAPSASSLVLGHSSSSSSKFSRTLREESNVMAAMAAEEDQETPEEEQPAPLKEIPPPSPIVFRCPLMELDSNIGRTFELGVKKSKIQIIENITIKASNGFHVEPVATNKPVEINDAADAQESQPLTSAAAEPEADPVHQEDVVPPEAGDLTNANAEAETSQVEKKVDADDTSQASVAAPAPAPARFCAESLSSESSDDDVMVLDDTNVDDSDSDVEAVVPTEEPTKTQSSDIIRDMMQSSIPLEDLPNRGDSIIFKLLKIKGNPSSGNTDFLAGNCTYINRRSKVLTLEIISYPPEFKRILRQYMSSLDESGDEVHCLNVTLKDMVDAKIIVDTID